MIATAWRAARLPLLVYGVSRLVDGLMLVLAMRSQPALGSGNGQSFVVGRLPASPGYLDSITNWDGQWFEQIVLHGWPHHLPTVAGGAAASSTWAFYPVYPALVRLVMLAGASYAVAAGVVATLCGAGACVLLHRLVLRSGGPWAALVAVVALCVFPASPVLQAAYSESTALLVLLVCLWLLATRRYLWLVPAALLLGLTRPIGLPLAVVIALHGWLRRRDLALGERRRVGLAALAAAVGFGIWPLVCGLVTGDLFGYVRTEDSWSDGSASSWLGHLVPPTHDGLAALVILAYAVALCAGPWGRRWGVLRLWSPVYVLYLLAATRPVPSLIRFTMLGAVPWIPVPTAPRRRTAILVLAALVAAGLAAQWIWLRELYVIDDTSGYP